LRCAMTTGGLGRHRQEPLQSPTRSAVGSARPDAVTRLGEPHHEPPPEGGSPMTVHTESCNVTRLLVWFRRPARSRREGGVRLSGRRPPGAQLARWYERNAKVASQVIATVTFHPKGVGARSSSPGRRCTDWPPCLSTDHCEPSTPIRGGNCPASGGPGRSRDLRRARCR
jgi:hypothetical protein